MWKCSKCGVNNVNYNKICARHRCNTIRPEDRPDSFDELLQKIHEPQSTNTVQTNVAEINVHAVISAGFMVAYTKGSTMTPQEQLFSELFNHEKVLVKDMDTLTLRAHREQLATIAFEARARLTAVDDEERGRKKKHGEAEGFKRSVNTDETATNAINTIKERQKRMSKADKILAGLEKLGISTADAAKLMSAGTILGRIRQKASELDGIKPEVSEAKPVFNPFEKKE